MTQSTPSSTPTPLARASALLVAVALATPIASHLWNQMAHAKAPPTLWSWWADALPHIPSAPLDVVACGTPLFLAALVSLLTLRRSAGAAPVAPRTEASGKPSASRTTAATSEEKGSNDLPSRHFGDDATRVGRPAALEVEDSTHGPVQRDTVSAAHDEDTDPGAPGAAPNEGPFDAPTRRETLRDVPPPAVEPVSDAPDARSPDNPDGPFDADTRRVPDEQTPFRAATRQADTSYNVIQGLSALDDDEQDDS